MVVKTAVGLEINGANQLLNPVEFQASEKIAPPCELMFNLLFAEYREGKSSDTLSQLDDDWTLFQLSERDGCLYKTPDWPAKTHRYTAYGRLNRFYNKYLPTEQTACCCLRWFVKSYQISLCQTCPAAYFRMMLSKPDGSLPNQNLCSSISPSGSPLPLIFPIIQNSTPTRKPLAATIFIQSSSKARRNIIRAALQKWSLPSGSYINLWKYTTKVQFINERKYSVDFRIRQICANELN